MKAAAAVRERTAVLVRGASVLRDRLTRRTPEPAPEAVHREWRAARRAAARRHHPDLGGSTEDYVEALAAVDRAYAVESSAGGPVPPGASRVGLRRRHAFVRAVVPNRRQVRRAGLRVRQVIPRGMPGSRRFVRL